MTSRTCLRCSFCEYLFHFKEFGIVSCHSQEGPQRSACLVSQLFPTLHPPRTLSSLADKLLSTPGTLAKRFLLPGILFSLLFTHRTPVNPLGLSCWVSFPRESSPRPEIQLGTSLISDYIASYNFLHGNYPLIVITKPLGIINSLTVLFITLISLPTIIPGT